MRILESVLVVLFSMMHKADIYYTELLIAPEMLGEPRILTGADNALHGFNSGVGTVSYTWSEMVNEESNPRRKSQLRFKRLPSGYYSAYRITDLH